MTDEQRTQLEGDLGRVLWTDGSFAIARIELDDGQRWVIKGDLAGLGEGERIAVVGSFVDDAKWGRQFRVRGARPVLPTTSDGIARYLAASGVKGIGPRLAERIASTFGDQTLTVIAESPERLAEVRGLGVQRRQALSDALGPRLARDQALLVLHGLPLSPWQVRRVVEAWGEDATRIVRATPYRLAEVPGLGFATADKVARQAGVAEDAPARIDAGIQHALDRLSQRGHTAPLSAWVDHQAAATLRCDEVQVTARREALCRSGALVALPDPTADRVASARLNREEHRLASALLRLAVNRGAPLPPPEVERRLALAADALGFPLEGPQRAAVQAALSGALLVVTGGPGTGKTTLIQGVLAASAPDELRVALAAPTGRAARRLGEATDSEALTVHRLLEVDPATGRFGRDAETPLDAELVIIDEASMLDVRLARSLCEAVAPGARLLLVGDVDQLPSVGPGAVLHDLIASRRCPVVRLTLVHRQGTQSSIVRNAHRVRQGLQPESDSAASGGDFFVIARRSPEAIVKTVVEVVQRRLPERYGFDPIDDIQVLVPIHRGAVGTEALNAALRDALVPDAAIVAGDLRQGDKVIQLRNNYDLEVFNGDVGRVVGASADGVRVRFSGRLVDVPTAELGDLRPAYAITVHKAQGSEYPAVVLVLHGQHHLLLQRNLIYTALTRARQFCVVVGDPSALERAVRDARPQHRSTQLTELLHQGSRQ